MESGKSKGNWETGKLRWACERRHIQFNTALVTDLPPSMDKANHMDGQCRKSWPSPDRILSPIVRAVETSKELLYLQPSIQEIHSPHNSLSRTLRPKPRHLSMHHYPNCHENQDIYGNGYMSQREMQKIVDKYTTIALAWKAALPSQLWRGSCQWMDCQWTWRRWHGRQHIQGASRSVGRFRISALM